jgi:hypothetical protein
LLLDHDAAALAQERGTMIPIIRDALDELLGARASQV